MSRYLTARDLPEVLTVRDVSEWSGVDEESLLLSLSDAPHPDGVHAGRPFWLATTVLRWRPLPSR